MSTQRFNQYIFDGKKKKTLPIRLKGVQNRSQVSGLNRFGNTVKVRETTGKGHTGSCSGDQHERLNHRENRTRKHETTPNT